MCKDLGKLLHGYGCLLCKNRQASYYKISISIDGDFMGH